MRERKITLPETIGQRLVLVGNETHEIIDLPTFGSCTIVVQNGKIEVVKVEKTIKPNIV